EAGKRFVDGVELFSHLANIGDVRSLIIHPASTTHSQLDEEQLEATGTKPGLVRLSVGIEHLAALEADLQAGFRAAQEAARTPSSPPGPRSPSRHRPPGPGRRGTRPAGASGTRRTRRCHWRRAVNCPACGWRSRRGAGRPRTAP